MQAAVARCQTSHFAHPGPRSLASPCRALAGAQNDISRFMAACQVAPVAPGSWARQRWQQQWRQRQLLATASSGGTGPESASTRQDEVEDARERRYVRALLLAFFASQNRSLFAAKCLVEVVVDMYRHGHSVDDAKVALSLASLQHGGTLLSATDEDVLLSWVAAIMIAMEMVGLARLPEGEERRRRRDGEGGRAEDTTSMGAGLKGLVRVGVDKFLAGTDLYRLQLEQSMAGRMDGDPDAMGESPAVRILQQNTRLVIIALEVVRDMGLPTVVPLRQPPPPVSPPPQPEAADDAGRAQQTDARGSSGDEENQGTGGADAAAAASAGLQRSPPATVSPGFMLAFDPEALAQSNSRELQQRAAGVRMLISFMGAALGWLYPATDFVEQCCECYCNGWPADEVYTKLQDEEFAQSGGIPGLRVARMAGTSNVSAAVLARWISLTYITLAQLRVVFPGAMQQEGWAWVQGAAERHAGGDSTTLEAYGLADFVMHTLSNEERREQEQGRRPGSGSGSGSSSDEDAAGADGSAAEQQAEALRMQGVPPRPAAAALGRRPQQGFVVLEDPRLLSTSPTTLVMSQQISLIQMTRQLVLQERARAAPQSAA